MQPAASHLAILGAGLSGLSSAFHLSRRFPTAFVHLVDKNHDLGGWVHSQRVELPNSDQSVLLESGPRTLRPNAQSILELINLLNLQDQLITTSTASPAAKSRFLKLTQGEHGLVTIPSSPWAVLRSSLRSVMLNAVMGEPFKKPNRPQGITDESFDSFMTRRFGSEFARVFGSALVHGIYATDSRQLSVRAAFPVLWEAEDRGNGSLLRGLLRPKKSSSSPPLQDAYKVGTVQDSMKGVSVYSFKNGISTLTSALEQSLSSTPNVVIHRGTSVASLTKSSTSDQTFRVSLSDGTTIPATHIVSTIPLPALNSLLSKNTNTNLPSIPHLTYNPYTSVTVVNLVFNAPLSAIHPAGFGYLIPRPKDGYPTPDSNPLGILGTVFDSSSLSPQDSSTELTKLTVMLGGPYPSNPFTQPLSTSSATSSSTPSIITSILAHLQSSFHPYTSTPLPNPVYWKINHNQHCIPTYLPGHLDRMEEMKEVLKGEGWEGRIEVIGAGVGGVSVGDCVEAGRKVGDGWL
ncbi:Protoporphyrinogen oxidase [Pluteus cervinus]|uniref:Protoporphyrinogen oxidase n=1 Tax=Pluteus cervinus TaxID=181527 RepID=A0ACD3B5J9_9AGAR|nr:Protoporphyrinogen oxidase [Pluteus cervinus]